ncbi:MAG: sensor histidine kinase, partial [Flavobacteriales bacterium]
MHIQAQNADVLRVLELAKKDYAFPVNNADQKLINEAYVAFKFQLPSADSLKQELEKIDHELAPVDSAAYHFAFGVKHYYLYEYDKSLELCSKSYKILEQENQITAGLFVKVIITNLIYASKQEEEAFAMYNEILAHDSCPAFMVGKLNHNIGALLFEVESEALMGDDLEEKKRVFDLIDKHMKASADFHKAKGDFASLSSNLSIWVTSKIQQEQFVEAIALVDSVVSIAESMGDFNRKAFTLIKKAQIQDGIGRPDLAVKTIDWAINHLDSIGDFVQYNHALSKKRASFLLLENYKGADSVAMVMYMNNVNNFDDELSESIANYQVQFETANDQLKIKEQELEISQRNLYLYLSIATLAGAVLVFLLLYQRSKRAAEAEKNKVLAESKKESVKAVIMAQEEERQRIAKDLHDGIVQQLGGLKLGLEKLFIHSSSLESERLLSVLDDSADELRTISHQMMPKALIELGLIPAMNDMLERSLGNTSIAYEFEHFGIVNRWEEAVE